MSTDLSKRLIFKLGVLALLWVLPSMSQAATIEVEEEDEEVALTPTPMAPLPKMNAAVTTSAKEKSPGPSQAPKVPAKNEDKIPPPPPAVPSSAPPMVAPPAPVAPNETTMPRVRISDKIGFYYLVKAGFFTKEKDRVPKIGKVLGSFDEQDTFSTPHKANIEFEEKAPEVKKDDLLVISRAELSVTEPRTNFNGYWVQNLGIVKVVEVEKTKCRVEVVKSFTPFEKGDWVRPYEDEVQRWKQAQTKKSLPDSPIQCFVAGGEPSRETSNKSDWVFLTAGAKRGLVEGQEFKLRKRLELVDRTVENFVGAAQVFYVGQDYSIAEILFNHVPIEKGFEAVYQP